MHPPSTPSCDRHLLLFFASSFVSFRFVSFRFVLSLVRISAIAKESLIFDFFAELFHTFLFPLYFFFSNHFYMTSILLFILKLKVKNQKHAFREMARCHFGIVAPHIGDSEEKKEEGWRDCLSHLTPVNSFVHHGGEGEAACH